MMSTRLVGGKRMTKVSEGKTKSDWAAFIRQLEEEYAHAEEVTPAMDNLSTHKAGSLYEAFSPEEATHIRDRFEFLYTPKHGSWLNMVEIELNVVIGQCLNRRMDSLPQVETAVSAWQAHRDNLNAKVNCHFTIQDAPVKLPNLCETLEQWRDTSAFVRSDKMLRDD